MTTTFTFSFTTYQLKLLAALDMGANTSGEIMELLEETIDKFARRRCCEAIKALAECGVVETIMIGGNRFAAIHPSATRVVAQALRAAGLEG